MAYYKIERDCEMDILEEPFTYKQAYLDLRQLTNFKEGTYRKQNGKIIIVPAGSLAWSEERLGKRWLWSRGKVSRFLSYIEGLGKIEQQNIGGNDWLIYIKGYSCDTTNDTTKQATNSTTNSTTNDTYKKEEQLMIIKNKEEEEKKILFLKKVFLTEKEYSSLVVDFGQKVVDSKIEDLNTYIVNNKDKYKDHNLTIRAWLKKDGVKKIEHKEITPSVETDDFFNSIAKKIGA